MSWLWLHSLILLGFKGVFPKQLLFFARLENMWVRSRILSTRGAQGTEDVYATNRCGAGPDRGPAPMSPQHLSNTPCGL